MQIKLTTDLFKKEEEILKKKTALWNQPFPQLQFDIYGRAKIGSISNMTASTLRAELVKKETTIFLGFFNEYLRNKGYTIKTANGEYREQLSKVSDFNFEDMVENYFHFFNTKSEKYVKVKASKVLYQVHLLWSKAIPVYEELVKEIKSLREQGCSMDTDSDLSNLIDDKKAFDVGNIFVQFDEILNIYSGSSDVYLSINPLDIFTASGGYERPSLNPTKFASCIGTYIDKIDDDIVISTSGGSSNPYLLLELSNLMNKAIIYIPNGNIETINNIQFIGYKERTHVWLDGDSLFMEKLYPSKSPKRKKEWEKALKENNMNFVDDADIFDFKAFGTQDSAGIKRYMEKRMDYNKGLYLDRVAINPNTNTLHYLTKDRLEYNSSNKEFFPTYYISSDFEMIEEEED